MKKLFGTEHDIVGGLEKTEAALALACAFLYGATKSTDPESPEDNCPGGSWPECPFEGNSLLGLAHILFETRLAVQDITEAVKEMVLEAKVKEFAYRQRSAQASGENVAEAQLSGKKLRRGGLKASVSQSA